MSLKIDRKIIFFKFKDGVDDANDLDDDNDGIPDIDDPDDDNDGIPDTGETVVDD